MIVEAVPLTHVGWGQAEVEKVGVGVWLETKRVASHACEEVTAVMRRYVHYPKGPLTPAENRGLRRSPGCLQPYYATHPMSYYADGRVTVTSRG